MDVPGDVPKGNAFVMGVSRYGVSAYYIERGPHPHVKVVPLNLPPDLS
jgi:hypothetical protein